MIRLLLAAFCGLIFVTPVFADTMYAVRHTAWTAGDERGFGAFITAIGASGCRSVDACLHDPANPFRASDPPGQLFRSDCADLPYVLRFYYAWKQGLPFSYVSDVAPWGRASDVRYSARGNQITARRDVLTGADALEVLAALRDAVSSATYRTHPDDDASDFYSPALTQGAMKPGTVIYDPNGHLALIWRIEADGRIHYIDAHPDNSLTRGIYDLRFVRASPGMGAGFKNWRPLRLAGASADSGLLLGGHSELTPNSRIADFSLAQYFGTGPRPADADWRTGSFALNGQKMDYYDYVRAMMAGGRLSFDPVTELREMMQSNCADLSYRTDAVTVALQAGLQNQPQPDRLPPNIYGADGDWETYSTPSRDARLKTAFKEVRDSAARFVALYRTHDPRLAYGGTDLVGDLLAAYDGAAAACTVSYVRSDGSRVSFGYEEARRRLFALSFDPYQCAERRWGADTSAEMAPCRDGARKQAWYLAEQRLRNQIDRTYEARMDFALEDLGRSGVAEPPDTDARAFLLSAR